MLLNESIWVKNILDKYVEEGEVVLNVGAQTESFLEQQPWIRENINNTLEKKKVKLINVDIKADVNVDIVADITKPDDSIKASELDADLIICANVLEHVEERETMVEALSNLVKPEGYLLVTVPYKFPYHPDPIDTMYRPELSEIIAEFSHLEVIGKKTTNEGVYLDYLSGKKSRFYYFMKLWFGKLFRLIKALFLLRERSLLWEMSKDLWVWSIYFSSISTNCVIFKKIA